MAGMQDFRSLIPELGVWNNGAGIDVDSWISAIGRYDHAIGYSRIFWPEFYQFENCIFRRRVSPEEYRKWMDSCGGNKSGLEAFVNHLHILDLFYNSDFEPSEPVLVHLGKVLKDMWGCKLSKAYPSMRFQVDFLSEGNLNPIDYQITFYRTDAR